MKKFLPAILIIGTALALIAQTNFPAPATRTNAPVAERPTDIFSDSGDFDLKSNVFVYLGNVRFLHPQMNLTSDILTFEMLQQTNVFRRATADGKQHRVFIDWWDSKGETNHAIGDKAVYTYSVTNAVTNEMVVLTGDRPVTWSEKGTNWGDEIDWDRMTGKIHVVNPKTEIPAKGTNAPDLFGVPEKPKTNSPTSKPGNPPQ
jgi:lipopolysaccharide export system protein LptA